MFIFGDKTNKIETIKLENDTFTKYNQKYNLS